MTCVVAASILSILRLQGYDNVLIVHRQIIIIINLFTSLAAKAAE